MACAPDYCVFNSKDCHSSSYRKECGYIEIEKLSAAEVECLQYRSGIQRFEEKSLVCFHHYTQFVKKYPSWFKVCCDPFQKHSRHVRSTLREISLEDVKRFENFSDLIPGKKLCFRCFKELEGLVEPIREPDECNDAQYVCGEEHFKERKEKLNNSLTGIDCSPIKKIRQERLESYAKRKYNDAKNKLAASFTDVLPGLEKLSVCDDCDHLMGELRLKFLSSNNREDRIRILTLAPTSWTRSATASFFETSEYLVNLARETKKELGILEKPHAIIRHRLQADVLERVKQFYERDDVSRMCPGRKDYVAVRSRNGAKEKVQKRLLLCNIREIYLLYKTEFPNDKIGFSSFCQLRPKWCTTVGHSGSHNVCVCSYHQNLKLMLSAIDPALYYVELMRMCVCDLQNKACMLKKCDSCPGIEKAKEFLDQLISAKFEEDEMVSFKQWEKVDRSNLIDVDLDIEDFLNDFSDKLCALLPHHFIYKHQDRFFKEKKDSLGPNECVIVMDFAENYTFVVQDAIQSFHWNNAQATIHPFVIYYKNGDGTLEHQSLACISNELRHDVVSVYAFQSKVLNSFVKQRLSHIEKIYYFSDGCSGHYKNYKNFTNLLYHFQDFGMVSEWHFFATSHGKNACDGIGGTIKRLAAYASLQRTTTGQILTPLNLFDFAQKEIPSITSYYVSLDEIKSFQPFLEERFQRSKTIPGTRSNHCFVPTSDFQHILLSTVSGEEVILPTKVRKQIDQQYLQVGTYIACIYEKDWFIGVVNNISMPNNDAEIRFMHPKGPSAFFKWPERDDICWVPFEHIISTIKAPKCQSGEQVYFEDIDIAHILSCFDNLF